MVFGTHEMRSETSVLKHNFHNKIFRTCILLSGMIFLSNNFGTNFPKTHITCYMQKKIQKTCNAF